MGTDHTRVTPEAFVDADGPVPNAHGLRAGVRLGITSEPGQTPDLSNVSTFSAAEVAVDPSWVLSTQTIGKQVVSFSVVGEWGFSSLFSLSGEDAVQRYPQHFGGGIRLTERSSGSAFTVLYGRDQAVGEFGWGQVMIYGSVPITGKGSVVALTGDATISMGPRDKYRQIDVLRLGVVVDLGSVLSKLR